MGARVSNSGGKYRTDLKRNRYLPFNIFLDKRSVNQVYSGRNSFPINLFDYIHAVLDQEVACVCSNSIEASEVEDFFIPENIFVNARASSSKTRQGYKEALDIVDAVQTVAKASDGCGTIFNTTKALVISPRRLREFYIPEMVTVEE